MLTDYDKVHTMNDYYDGPRKGIADFRGQPVLYQSRYLDVGASKIKDIFFLQPIDARLFQLALEDWDIWLRWDRAFKEGKTTEDSCPALPLDRSRHEEIKPVLDSELQIDETRAFQASGDFTVIDGQMYVKWRQLDQSNEL